MNGPDTRAAVRSAAPGRTTITARALEHLVVCLVRESARAPRREISVRLADSRGALRVSVTVPVVLGARSAGSIAERGTELRRSVIAGVHALAGRTVDVVDVRYSGMRRIDERRVR